MNSMVNLNNFGAQPEVGHSIHYTPVAQKATGTLFPRSQCQIDGNPETEREMCPWDSDNAWETGRLLCRCSEACRAMPECRTGLRGTIFSPGSRNRPSLEGDRWRPPQSNKAVSGVIFARGGVESGPRMESSDGSRSPTAFEVAQGLSHPIGAVSSNLLSPSRSSARPASNHFPRTVGAATPHRVLTQPVSSAGEPLFPPWAKAQRKTPCALRRRETL